MVPDLWAGILAPITVGPHTILPVVLRTPNTMVYMPAPTYRDLPTKSTRTITALPISISTIVNKQGGGTEVFR